MDSGSEDADIFITQNTFQNSPNFDLEFNPLDISISSTVAQNCEEILDHKSIEQLFGKEEVYQPQCSDISDEELLASCQNVEASLTSDSSRFVRLSEDDIADKCSKRYRIYFIICLR